MKDSNSNKIVFLYSEILGYNLGVFKSLIDCNPDIYIHVFHWDKQKQSNYSIESNTQIRFYRRSQQSTESICNFLIENSPSLIYVSGWMDKGYLQAIRNYRKINSNSKVVMGTDGQWHNTTRQKIGSFLFKLVYRQLFDYAWIAGKRQYEYVRKFGFQHSKIISNLLSADTAIFHERANVSKRFVFIGRMAEVKNIRNLIQAHNYLIDNELSDWCLDVYGDGPLREELEGIANHKIRFHKFLQPDKLREELSRGGVFVLPSFKEPWGVVIHESSLMGYPLVLSKSCGAATEFLISGYNGFSFNPKNNDEMKSVLEKISNMSDKELDLFSQRSIILGKRISSDISAASLLSVLS